MSTQDGNGGQAPQLAAHIDGFDNHIRLLIAVAARACANARLPQDSSIASDDLDSITENLAAFQVDEAKQSQPSAPAAASKPTTESELEARDFDLSPEEVDPEEVQESARAIAVAAAANQGPQLSEEDKRREREQLRASIAKVEAANAEAARRRRQQALQWADEVARHCKFDPEALPPKPRAADLKPSVKALSHEKHHEILHDILMLSVHLPPPHKDDKSTSQKQKEAQEKAPADAGVYTALARYLVFAFAQVLNIPPSTVYDAEKAMAQQLYFVFEETKKAEAEHEKQDGNAANKLASRADNEKMKAASQGAIAEREKKNSTWKWAATGAGFLAGGVILGVTGGLAAPLLAPLLVTATGGALSFLATSGGAVLLGTMFGLTGGGLTAFRAKRRMEGIEEFEFVKIEDPDVPNIPSLSATIISSGFLVNENDWIEPYKQTILYETKDRRDAYALKAETGVMHAAGKALDSYVKNFLIGKGVSEIIKRTALAAVFSAIALPATVYKTATKALDNEFQRSTDRAQKAGIILADVLEKGVQGNRPTVLIGSSLGAITVMSCLLELQKRNLGGLVFDAILISLPAAPTPAEWLQMRQVTSRRLVNAYSANDWVLAIIARLHTLISTRLSFGVAGLGPVKIGSHGDAGVPIVENIDLSDVLKGHLELAPKMAQVLERIGLEK